MHGDMNAQSREKSLSTPLEGDRDRGSGWRRFYERITSIDYASVERRISGYLREYLEEAGAGCYVLGLSGGIDSSVVTTLAARAVGPERVVALIMPDSTSTPGEDLEDARWLVRHLNIRFHEAPIDTLVAAASTSVPLFDQTDLKALGNLKARIRMLMLYYVANRLGGIVLGSGDRSELLLGYFTKYGDGAADLLPIGDLYKSQVRGLAKHLGLPDRIALKPSSPRLWPGQMAESELGFTYDVADVVLYAVFDLGYAPERVVEETGIPYEKVRSILSRVESSAHKRRLPPVVELKGVAHP